MSLEERDPEFRAIVLQDPRRGGKSELSKILEAHPELKPCAECGALIRPKNKHKADYPFTTIAPGAGDLCYSCHKAAKQPVPNPLTDREYGATLRGYLRYLAGRQQRLAAAGGSR